ncbi:MAG: SDR family oxidoreductase, partial [Bacteroidales bacterium]|nr:SDR family oxidoreductase [Bacteroidales bacterium]
KVALVTGAASGIGYEFTKLLVEDSYNIILIDKESDKLIEIKQSFENEYDSEIKIIAKDLSNPSSAKEIYDELTQQQIRIDILINNAGFGIFGKFTDTNWEEEYEMIQLHVVTSTLLVKLFLKDMVERKAGKILFVTSVAAFYPGPFMSIYNATKAYLQSFAEAIANELKGTGVTVTVLSPGLTKTGFQKAIGGKEPKINQSWASAVKVAQYGYKAMHSGRVIVIPGFLNYILANAGRFLTRNAATNIVGKLQKKNKG